MTVYGYYPRVVLGLEVTVYGYYPRVVLGLEVTLHGYYPRVVPVLSRSPCLFQLLLVHETCIFTSRIGESGVKKK